MPPKSLTETLFPLADASTLPRSKLHSPFSPLVGWLSTLWALEDHDRARMDTFLYPGEEFFVSPADFPEPPNAPPPSYSVDTTASYDDRDASERSSPLIWPHKYGLTEKEFDYVVTSLLEYLEEAELESGCEEYEYYAPENTAPHDLWYVRVHTFGVFGAHHPRR